MVILKTSTGRGSWSCCCFKSSMFWRMIPDAMPAGAPSSVEGPCKQGSSILRLTHLGLCPPCLAQLRASSIATLDDGAGCGRRQCGPRMERREAQGPSHGPVRPRKTHRLADRKAGLREPIARLPGASRRSIPLVLRGNGKQGRRAGPEARKQTPRAAKRWLKQCLASKRCRDGTLQATQSMSCAGLTRASIKWRNRRRPYKD